MLKNILLDIKEPNRFIKNCPPHAKIKVYYEIKDERDGYMKKLKKNKYTLNQIGEMVVGIKDDVKQINTRIDRIDARLDNLENRIDYIVNANNLKDTVK